jgi:hypothetical protein
MGFLNLTRLITLIAMLVAALALPAVATADGDDVIRDCARDGDLDEEYSDEELEDASENMPSDLDAYSSCREVIRRAQAGGRGSADGTGDSTGAGGAGGSGSGGAGDGAPGSAGPGGGRATPSDIGEITRRQQEALDGTEPATSAELAAGADAGDEDGLPAAALIAIALLGLAAIAGGVYLLRDHLPPGLTSRLPGASR